MTVLWAIYLIGVIVGLVFVDGSPFTRVWLAVAWPLGLLAFVLTITVLVIVAAMAFPWFGLTIAAVAAMWWFIT